MRDEVWVMGVFWKFGGAEAARLAELGADVVLVARKERDMDEAMRAAPRARTLVAGKRGAIETLRDAGNRGVGPRVVVSVLGGPGSLDLLDACPAGSHYVDAVSAHRHTRAVLKRSFRREAKGSVYITGAGFRGAAAEAAALRVRDRRPAPHSLRVDTLPAVRRGGGEAWMEAIADALVHGADHGAREVRDGAVVAVPAGSSIERVTTPDGDKVRTGAMPGGELIAAWKALDVRRVVAASSEAPTRWQAARIAGLVRRRPVSDSAFSRLANLGQEPGQGLRGTHSWARARATWETGEQQTVWLRCSADDQDFTARVVAGTAVRLLRGEGKPGMLTPGDLAGTDIAVEAGGELLDEM